MQSIKWVLVFCARESEVLRFPTEHTPFTEKSFPLELLGKSILSHNHEFSPTRPKSPAGTLCEEHSRRHSSP